MKKGLQHLPYIILLLLSIQSHSRSLTSITTILFILLAPNPIFHPHLLIPPLPQFSQSCLLNLIYSPSRFILLSSISSQSSPSFGHASIQLYEHPLQPQHIWIFKNGISLSSLVSTNSSFTVPPRPYLPSLYSFQEGEISKAQEIEVNSLWFPCSLKWYYLRLMQITARTDRDRDRERENEGQCAAWLSIESTKRTIYEIRLQLKWARLILLGSQLLEDDTLASVA